MQARQTGSDVGCEKITTSSVINGFHYFQPSVCGYNSCTSTAPHFHCMTCGYSTSELPHAAIHKESCVPVTRTCYSQSPSIQSITSQAAEHPFTSTTYDPGTESTVSTTSINSVQSTMQISNSGNHLYYRGGMSGSQQSPVFNPLLSSQNQPLYSGVFSSQVTFTNQNNYPSSFNGYGHLEPPPWLSDSRMSSSANSTPTLEAGRSSKACNSQGISHSCCGSRVGLLENIGLCSPLSTDTYKPLTKDAASCQHKNSISMESQNWFCGQSVLGYSSQVSAQSLQNSLFKCTDPFPSCSMTQLGISLNEQGELKHPGTCYDINSVSKHGSPCHSSRKSNCLEGNKDGASKYCSQQKNHPCGLMLDNTQCVQQKDQESSGYDSHSMIFGSVDGDLHDDIYCPNTVVIPNSDDRTGVSYTPSNKGSSFNQSNPSDTNKAFSNHCPIPACDVIDSCLQLEGQPLYQYPHISAAVTTIEEDRASNTGSCSGAAESDIIVEESEEEEINESEVSVDEAKSKTETKCLVCSSSNASFIRVSELLPLTSTSHTPVATKLAQVIPSDCKSLPFQNELICKRCLNLVDTVDSLENKLATVKQNLIELYESRVAVEKPTEKCKNETEEAPQNGMKIPEALETSGKSDDLHTTAAGMATERLPENQEGPESKLNPEATDKTKEDSTTGYREYVDGDGGCAGGDSGGKFERDAVTDTTSSSSSEDEQAAEPTDGKSARCGVCGKVVASREYLRKHMQRHTQAFSFYCDRCGRGFALRSGLEKHLRAHAREQRFQCEVCGRCFVWRHALLDHLRRHRGSLRLACARCGKGFANASALRAHERSHTGDKPFVCQRCGRRFSSASHLSAHALPCAGELPLACCACDRRFATAARLRAHEVAEHRAEPRLRCDACGKGFSKPSDMRAHARSHSGAKPHRCGVCGRCYSSVGNLNQHAKRHSEERPFACSVCGKGFLRRSGLQRHENQHAGVRPFPCTHCGKGFASPGDRRAHEKLHTGALKQYACRVCGKTMHHGLKVHMRTHTGDKPYKCIECKAAFSVKSSLDKHVKLKHQRIT